MSSRAVKNRKILLNITNMDDNQGEITTDKTLGGADGGDLRDVNGVKSVQVDPTTPVLGATTKGPPSCGENGNNLNKFESGSGSGEHEHEHEHDGIPTDDGIDTAAKKRKTRRGKPKHRKLKPYSKQQISYEQRLKSRGILSSRLQTKTGRQTTATAPYNTTQFLMEDHSDLPDLEQKLSGAACGEALPIFQKPTAPPRTRDSSFSIDSEDDYFYSSPEDEEEFLTKEFSTAYEDLHAERLGGLTKSELIQEYIQLESKVDLLTKRLRGRNFHQMEERDTATGVTTTTECGNKCTTNINNGVTTSSEQEVTKKLKICQQRIDDLIQQNEQLRRENEALKVQRSRNSDASSVDSESDSECSSDTSSCSCAGNSPIQIPAVITSGNSQIFIRREQKINGHAICSVDDTDSESNDDDTPRNNHHHHHRHHHHHHHPPPPPTSSSSSSSNRLPESSPKPNHNGNIISNGHATTQEVNGLPT